MKEKLFPFLVVGLVITAFAAGLLYGKVSVYEKQGTAAGAQDTGNQALPQEPEQTTLTDAQWQDAQASYAAAMGEEDAPVTIVEYTDYQCPFCARFYTDSYGQIIENYVDTGKVRYLLRDLPLSFHANAKPAALAARCAGDQDKYFDMHDILFEKQAEWSEGSPADKFAGYAKDIGLNTGTWQSCYDSGKYNDAIDDDVKTATAIGATGTPTFFINGEKIVGALPYASFEAAIEAAL